MKTSSRKLFKKVCMISGGRTGIGLSIVLECLKQGANVVVLGRKMQTLMKTFKRSKKYKNMLHLYECDIRNFEQVKSTVNHVVSKLKRIDILINNASINFMVPAENLKPNMIDLSIDTNLKGHLFLITQVGKQMIKQPGTKKIINMSAYAGGKAYPGFSHFHACKAGLDALTRTLSIEWSKYNILVNSISPGPVLTDNFINAYSRLFKLRKQTNAELFLMGSKLPLKNFIPVKEIVDLIIFIASDSSKNITGQTIAIDGGVGIVNEYFLNLLEKK